jgi:hypothetical protein
MKQITVEGLAKQVRILKLYALAVTLIVIGMMVLVLKTKNSIPKEITVERINIVEKDGKIRMVLSNRARQHPGRMDNQDLPKRDRPAGLLFFNDEGDECGGLGYNGGKKEAAMFMTMDQYKNDQIMVWSYDQVNTPRKKVKSYGFTLNDRDDLPLSKQIQYFDSLKTLKDTAAYNAGVKHYKAAGHLAQRMFLGKSKSGEVGLFLADKKGHPRIKIFVNNENQPVIQTLDEQGNVVK